MKRRALIQHLKKHGCYFICEGRNHSIWEIQRMVPKLPSLDPLGLGIGSQKTSVNNYGSHRHNHSRLMSRMNA